MDSPNLSGLPAFQNKWVGKACLTQLQSLRLQFSLSEINAIFPYLRSSDSKHIFDRSYQPLLETITPHFDLVVIDGPHATNPLQDFDVQTIDSAVIVRDVRLDNFGVVREWSTHLSMAELKSIGVVENHL